MTELQKLKKKCYKQNGQPRKDASEADLKRIKQLRDAEPLSQTDINEAQKREENRQEQAEKEFKDKRQGNSNATATLPPDPAIDKPVQEEHPRVKTLKQALSIFAQLEVDPGRQNEFVLIVRGVAITAGDVRDAREAMKV